MADENTSQEAPGGSPAPESNGTSAPETPPSEQHDNAEYDLLGLPDDDFVEVPAGEEPPTSEEPKAEETPPEAAKQPGEEPKPEEPKKDEAPPSKEQPKEAKKEEAPPEAPQEPSPAPSEERPLVEQLQENRDALIEAVAAERFALSKEDEEALELDAASYAPKLMARAYYESMVSTLNHINNLVPNMVMHVLENREVAQSATEAFYKQFGVLDPEKHGEDVMQFATMFRNSNPNISQEDLFQLVGAAVMAKHGLSAQPPVQQQAPAPQPKPQPYTPAPTGGSVKVTPEVPSQFEILGMPEQDE